MDYGFKYVKSAFALTVRHFLLVCFLVIIIPIPAYILFKVFPLAALLYLLTIVLYSMSGVNGYLCHHHNDRISIELFIKTANRYYGQNIITGLVFFVYALLIFLFLGLLIGIITTTIYRLDKVTGKLIWQLMIGVTLNILAVYVTPFLFVYDVKNGTAVKYGFKYFKFIIKNKRNEFLALFLLILASLTAGLAYKANFNLGIPVIWIGSLIIKNYLNLLIFLTAAIQLMADPKAKETVGVRDGDIIQAASK